jgi:hypothetical protein
MLFCVLSFAVGCGSSIRDPGVIAPAWSDAGGPAGDGPSWAPAQRDAGGSSPPSGAGPGIGPVCAAETIDLTPVVPNVLLVLDQSMSMANRFGGSDEKRIEALKRAASSAIADPLLDGKIRWGMTPFPIAMPDPQDRCGVFQGSPMVPAADGTVPAVLDAINAMTPFGATPTAEVLSEAASYLIPLTSTEHPSYVVLGTDGQPTCLDEISVPSRTVDATARLRNAGIRTFVIGIASTSIDGEVLGAIAEAGGTARPGPSKYYDAQDEAALVTALAEIASRVSSCSYRLGHVALNPHLLSVAVDGAEIPRDDGDGFTYSVDQSGQVATVTLNGSSCEYLQSVGAQALDVKLGCPPQG